MGAAYAYYIREVDWGEGDQGDDEQEEEKSDVEC